MFANLSPGTQEQGLVSETRKLRGWIERMWHLCSPFLHYGSYFPRGRRQMGLVSKLVNIKLKSLHLQICGHGLYGWNKWHCVSVLSDAENRVRDRSVIFFFLSSPWLTNMSHLPFIWTLPYMMITSCVFIGVEAAAKHLWHRHLQGTLMVLLQH